MKKVLAVILAAIFITVLFPLSAGAEELKAPTVQFKLINHDEIALRWNEVEGADYYCVYKTDTATGKTVKYKNPIKKTEVTVKGLSAETEYIFKVAAVSEKNGEVISEVKSRGTHVTTPKEWYYSYWKTTKNSHWICKYFKENYSKTIRKDIILEDIKYVEEFVYSDGWIYFIGIKGGYYVGRIRENGTGKEILFDDLGSLYRCLVHGDYIYLYRETFSDGFYDRDNCTYVSDYHKISLKTGEVSKICDVFESSYTFDVYDDYVYFIYYPLEYDEETKGYSDWNGYAYLCRAKIDGAGKEIICTFSEDISFLQMHIYNDEIYFYRSSGHSKKIYKMSLSGGNMQEILNSETYLYVNNFEIINGYIYFIEYSNESDQYNERNPIAYYRLKTDGTGLKKQDKPFEWKY